MDEGIVKPTGWVVDTRHYTDEATGDLPEAIPESKFDETRVTLRELALPRGITEKKSPAKMRQRFDGVNSRRGQLRQGPRATPA